ncbi:MAG: regulator [Gemmatimonadales bacterium]|nr:regulator [Gemmatimonadales bacterium]NIN12169.1 regulator [Gemmatimonadales bacterium]NIN50590.1 regulator [Gemmatimonadales bacterium]NIP08054.1 regulator [Gemmatimonadales bacterium]NIR00636.1 regulator [Gemmatimonadales bacterium]
MRRAFLIIVTCSFPMLDGWCQSDPPTPATGEPYVYTKWESFTTESTHGGLINDHIFYLEADGDSLWIGTEGGLVLYADGTWESWTEEDGLPWNVVMGIAKDPKTGDLWLALFGEGIARFSGGHFQHFTQMNSGLLNDVSYGIDVQGDYVWVASTAGISRYNQVTGEWAVFNEKHAPMEEVWTYNVSAHEDKVYFAVWGGGILEWDVATETWTDYVDPDREMEIDLYRDDGLIHVITTSASYVDNVLWAATYFGLSRYDGRDWRGYMDHDSGLPSNFINFALGRSGTSCYSATDKGLGVLADFTTDTWVTYARDSEDAATWTAHVIVEGQEVKTVPTDLDLPNHFVLSVVILGDDVWIGTGHGLARGIGKGYYEGLR